MTTEREVEEVPQHTPYVLAQVEQSRDRAIEEIADRIYRESYVSSWPGQCEALQEIARDLRDLVGPPTNEETL